MSGRHDIPGESGIGDLRSPLLVELPGEPPARRPRRRSRRYVYRTTAAPIGFPARRGPRRRGRSLRLITIANDNDSLSEVQRDSAGTYRVANIMSAALHVRARATSTLKLEQRAIRRGARFRSTVGILEYPAGTVFGPAPSLELCLTTPDSRRV